MIFLCPIVSAAHLVSAPYTSASEAKAHRKSYGLMRHVMPARHRALC